MSRPDPHKSRFSRKAVWLLPAVLVLIALVALLILSDGGALSALGYGSF